MADTSGSALVVMLGSGRGGLEQTAFDFADLYERAGFSTRMVLSSQSPYLSDMTRPVSTLANRGDWDLMAAFRLRRLIQTLRPGLVHVVGKRAARLTYRFYPHHQFPRLIASTPAKNVSHLKNFPLVIVCTPILHQACLDAGMSADQLALIPNPVAVPQTRPDIRKWDHQRPIRIGTLGRLSKEKRFDLLIDATCELTRRGLHIETSIGGDGPLRQELEQRIDARPTCPVHLLGWVEDRDSFLGSCDLYVSTSDRETFGLSLAEAMASGIPVIATATDGSRTLIEDQQTGRLIPCNEPLALANAIEDMIADEALSIRMAEAAQQNIYAELAPAPLAKKLKTVLADKFPELS